MIWDYFALQDGAFFEPSSEEETKIIVDLLAIRRGDRAVDLGSGDGRIVIEMARRGAYADGIEKDAMLVHEALGNIETAGLSERAFVYNRNIWHTDLSRYNKVSIFQYHTVMKRLEEKLMHELSDGSLVVSHHWTFPNWKPARQMKDIYLYIK